MVTHPCFVGMQVLPAMLKVSWQAWKGLVLVQQMVVGMPSMFPMLM
jgi:hypothetical protein